MKNHEKAQRDHVPRRTAVVLHQVESVRHVRVTVVTAEIVLQNQCHIHATVAQSEIVLQNQCHNTFTPLSHNQRLCCRTNVTLHSRHCHTIRDCAAEPMSHYIHATVTQSEIVLQNQCHITFTPLSHNQRL